MFQFFADAQKVELVTELEKNLQHVTIFDDMFRIVYCYVLPGFILLCCLDLFFLWLRKKFRKDGQLW